MLSKREKKMCWEAPLFSSKKWGKEKIVLLWSAKKKKRFPDAIARTNQRTDGVRTFKMVTTLQEDERRGFIFLKKTVEKATLQFTCEMVQNGVDVVLLTFPPLKGNEWGNENTTCKIGWIDISLCLQIGLFLPLSSHPLKVSFNVQTKIENSSSLSSHQPFLNIGSCLHPYFSAFLFVKARSDLRNSLRKTQ